MMNCFSAETMESLDEAIKSLEQKPSEDAINRAAAIRLAEQGQVQGFEWQLQKLIALPPVTPTRKKGRWIRKPIRNNKGGCVSAEMICTYCGEDNELDKKLNFCPNCGAEMESDKK